MATEGSWKINAHNLRVRQRLHPYSLHPVAASFLPTPTFHSVVARRFQLCEGLRTPDGKMSHVLRG